VVATKTFTAGLDPSTDVAMLWNECDRMRSKGNRSKAN
jgi:hypothetical protein